MVSCEKRLFSLLFAIFESFCEQFVLSSDNAVLSKRFTMSSLFSKAILLWSIFPPDAGLSQPNSRKTFRKGFLVMSFPFTRFSSSKKSFFAGLSPFKFAYPLQKYLDKSLTLSVYATFGTKYPIGTIWIFFSRYLSGYFFIRIATGSTSDSHPLSVNSRPIWIKIHPTLYLSDSHPLSVNLALDWSSRGRLWVRCLWSTNHG